MGEKKENHSKKRQVNKENNTFVRGMGCGMFEFEEFVLISRCIFLSFFDLLLFLPLIRFISFLSFLPWPFFFLYPFQKVDFNSNGVAFVVVVANRRKALANETKNEHTIWWIKCAQQAGERGVSIDIPRVFYTNKIVFSCWYFFRFVSFHSMVFRLSSWFFLSSKFIFPLGHSIIWLRVWVCVCRCVRKGIRQKCFSSSFRCARFWFRSSLTLWTRLLKETAPIPSHRFHPHVDVMRLLLLLLLYTRFILLFHSFSFNYFFSRI